MESSASVDAAPARALHIDLVSRFKSLTGQSEDFPVHPDPAISSAPGLLDNEDGKTVEELLAELGPEDSWNVQKDEETQIDDLLQAASKALAQTPTKVDSDPADGGQKLELGNESSAQHMQTADRSYPPPSQQAEPTEDELDQEADEYLAQILEQIKHEPKSLAESEKLHDVEASRQEQSSTVAMHVDNHAFPDAPSKNLDPPSYADVTADDELASRLANLGLPSVPLTIKNTSTIPTAKPQQKGYTDEEIDSWCVICNEDATLRCVGCDGDLYCTKCWLDGHKGPDAGYDERTHKAVQYNKGGGIKKQSTRHLVGA